MITKYYAYEGFVTPNNLNDEEFVSFGDKKSGVLQVGCTKAKLNEFLKAQITDLQEITQEEFNIKKLQTPQGQNLWELIKTQRELELKEAIVAHENVEFNADEEAMDRFNRLISIANARYNQAVASGKTPKEAALIYETSFAWKGADNQFHELKISEMIGILEAAMQNMQSIWETRIV